MSHTMPAWCPPRNLCIQQCVCIESHFSSLEFHCVALTILELVMLTRLAWTSQSSAYLCLPQVCANHHVVVSQCFVYLPSYHRSARITDEHTASGLCGWWGSSLGPLGLHTPCFSCWTISSVLLLVFQRYAVSCSHRVLCKFSNIQKGRMGHLIFHSHLKDIIKITSTYGSQRTMNCSSPASASKLLALRVCYLPWLTPLCIYSIRLIQLVLRLGFGLHGEVPLRVSVVSQERVSVRGLTCVTSSWAKNSDGERSKKNFRMDFGLCSCLC